MKEAGFSLITGELFRSKTVKVPQRELKSHRRKKMQKQFHSSLRVLNECKCEVLKILRVKKKMCSRFLRVIFLLLVGLRPCENTFLRERDAFVWFLVF